MKDLSALKKILFALPLLSLAACTGGVSSIEVASLAAQTGSCLEAETFLQDALQKSLENFGEIPKTQDVKSSFLDYLNETYKNMSLEEKEDLTTKLENLYAIIEQQVLKHEGDTLKILSDLTKLEYGSFEDEKLQKDYSQAVQNYSKSSVKSLSSCTPPTSIQEETKNTNEVTLESGEVIQVPKEDLPFYEDLEKSYNLPTFGALKAFSAAYQTCESLEVSPLTREDENMQGVSRIGKHPNGVGSLRAITDLNKVLSTHPYIKNYKRPLGENCVDSTLNPLVYDYGGKPHSTNSNPYLLDFFKDHGSGSKTLGIDCSGYIYTGLMAAGLKLAPHKPIRGRGVLATPARHWKNLGTNMSCFKKVETGVGSQLKAGDIFASNGHIFIIVSLGLDPLGVEKALNEEACNKITHEDFNFSLMQSSPSKGSIGINHMSASDYLSGSSTMRKAFVEFARTDCKNKKSNKTAKQSISSASLVRHKLTPECIDSSRVKLKNESCLSRCVYKDSIVSASR